MTASLPARLTRDLTQPEPIPAEGRARALELMETGRLFRYGELGADQLDASLFEDEFAAFMGRKYCVAVNSCGCSLFLALKAVGIAAGDPVLVNGFTLAPVPGAIAHAGARPVIVEIGSDYLIDLDDLAAKARSSGARVLMLSHMRGHVANLERIAALCDELGLTLIEDCAHALCASWNGRAAGTFGAIGCFSTQTYKHLNSGEGGLMVMDDDDMAARTILHSGSYMLYRQHTRRPPDAVFERWKGVSPNYSMRMSALAAAVLRPQLAVLPERVRRWNANYTRITDGLRQLQLVHVPRRAAEEAFSATSVQFSLPGLSADAIGRFIASCATCGLAVKWFGDEEPVGFTSAPRHWTYIDDAAPLDRTHRVLAGLCDIRTPVSLTDSDCDAIVAIVRHALEGLQQESLNQGGST